MLSCIYRKAVNANWILKGAYIMKRFLIYPFAVMTGQKVFTEKQKLLKRTTAKKFCNPIILLFVVSRRRGGYSATTMRHVNSFLSFYDMNGGGKSWWDMQPVETEKPKAADMTPAESLKAMYNCRAANSVNY